MFCTNIRTFTSAQNVNDDDDDDDPPGFFAQNVHPRGIYRWISPFTLRVLCGVASDGSETRAAASSLTSLIQPRWLYSAWRLLDNGECPSVRREITLRLRTCALVHAAIQRPWAQWRARGETLSWHGGGWITEFRWLRHRLDINKDAFLHTFFLFLFFLYLWAAFSRIFFLSANRSCQTRTKDYFKLWAHWHNVGCFQRGGGRLVSTQGVVSECFLEFCHRGGKKRVSSSERLRHLVATRCKRALISHVWRQLLVRCA